MRVFDMDWDSVRPDVAAQKLLEDSGYIKMWQESKDIDAPDRLENITELLSNVVSKYNSLPEFLEHAALMMTDDNDTEDGMPNNNTVSIMTIHAAKGLEFDTVFLPAWEDGIFPNDKAANDGGMEEERRLAYVAITRAKRRAIITNTMSRMVFGERKYNPPSRFIAEIDRNFLNIQGEERFAKPKIQTSYKPIKRVIKSESNVGKLASHSEMGRGVIIEENGDILTVAFRNKGIKKVDKKFLKIGNI